MENLRIGIVGNIGVGKSSLVEAASKGPMADMLLNALPECDGTEKVCSFQEEINPVVLKEFYKDPIANAFLAQIEFFNGRLDRQKRIPNFRGIILEDRTLAEDYYIFGMAQRILGHMNEAEFQVYQRTFEMMSERIPYPDLIVYLRAKVDTLTHRVSKRSRANEEIPGEYLETLNELYEEFVARHVKCPVLVVDANEGEDDMAGYHLEIIQKIADKVRQLDLRVTTPGMCEWVSLPETKATIRAIEAEKRLRDYLSENDKLITIAGNVGLGKSTLAAVIAGSLGIKGLYENPEKNPLLEQFLGDKKKYCFQLQQHFLKMRSEQRKQAKALGKSSVKDRSFAEDILVFCHQFNQDGLLTTQELERLNTSYKSANKELPSADLMIVLQGSPELAWRRIQQRGREMEVKGGWSFSEIQSLNSWYRTYPKDVRKFGYHKGPVLILNIEKMDLTNRVHIGYVFEKIYQELVKAKVEEVVVKN